MMLRRTLLATAPLAAALARPARAGTAQADTAPLCMVMNSGEASVSLIDMTTRQVTGTVATLREPSHWALSPDKTKLYIADSSGNALFILDPRTGQPIGHLPCPDPYQIGYTPDQRYFVVNSLRLDTVEIYAADATTLVKRFSPGKMPSHLDFSPDSRWSFNSMQESGTLVSFDLTTMTTRWTQKVGDTPAGVLWLNGKVLCCIMGADHFVVVDPATGAIERAVQTGTGCHNLFLTPDRKTLYVSNRVGGTLSVLDATTLTLQRNIPLPGGPDDMGIAPDGKLWIALRFREAVAIMDPASGQYDTVDVGRSPHGIFLTTELSVPGLTAEML